MFRRPAAVIALTTALALATTAPALASGPKLDVTGATLLSRGAAVRVNLQVSCDDTNESYEDAYLRVTVRQVQKKKIVEGSSSTPVDCTGSSQNKSITVTAYGQPFAKGAALVTATLTTYSWPSEEDTDEEETRLR
jgi:hypothetical protein